MHLFEDVVEEGIVCVVVHCDSVQGGKAQRLGKGRGKERNCEGRMWAALDSARFPCRI